MNVTIDCSKGVALSLEPATKTERIIQSIFIVLNTVAGEVPCYREFGIDASFEHKPIQAAQSLYAASATEAIERFVPEVQVQRITFADSQDDSTTLRPILEVSISETDQ